MKKLLSSALNATLFRVLDYYVVYRLFPLIRRHFLQDFRTQQHLLATLRTAEYVQKHMRVAKALGSSQKILEHAIAAADKPGMYMEFGVFEGKTINYIASLTDRTVHGFDSFEGLPEHWTIDNPAGKFTTDESWRPNVAGNVQLHVGWFGDTLPKFIVDHADDVSFLHVDCDLYSSTKTIFQFLGDQIKSGAVILFDEYFNYIGWQDHEFAAFNEFVKERGLSYEYIAFHENGQQVAVRIC